MSFMEKIALAAAQTDMNEAVSGGGGLELPAAGMTRLRLISYIELGIHPDSFTEKGVTTVKNKEMVHLEFELSGPKHPATNEETGREKPFTIGFAIPKSQNEKATYYKLFRRLNPEGKYRHFAELLGQAMKGTVVHVTKGEGADKKTYANLRDADGLTIQPPYIVNEEGDSVLLKVAPAVNPLKCFLWDYADKEMWDALFIDGFWPDKTDKDGKIIKAGASKNYWQNRIMAAVNFKESIAGGLVASGGEEPDIPDAETPGRGRAADEGADADPLAGV